MSQQPTLWPVLGPLALTTLGIGSVIGTGIFVLTGTVVALTAGLVPLRTLSELVSSSPFPLSGHITWTWTKKRWTPPTGPSSARSATAWWTT